MTLGAPRVLSTRKVLKKMRFVVAAALVPLWSYQAELVRADDALNGLVVEAFGECRRRNEAID